MGESLLWVLQNLVLAPWYLLQALISAPSWLSWTWNGLSSTEDKQALMRFIYYGASHQFLFVFIDFFLLLLVLGLWRQRLLWLWVRIGEGFGNSVGRAAAWAGLLMVLQQVIIVFLQRIFRVAEIKFGLGAPLGYEFFDFLTFGFDLSWWAEELKLYNAIIVTLCCAYTFIQGGHVRVDLFYAGMRFRAKKVVDMIGSVLFMMPALNLIWLYAWFFMWRHLVTPKVSASDKFELLLRKARILKWNVETIGFSPNGFNGYFLFKVLMVAFVFMMLVQAMTFFFRSLAEFREGPEAEGKYLDKDTLGEGEEVYEGTH
ncbi:MAG: C4-dicarboxylate ABC transporter permease [Alphaproteobacteria bacterium]|nr:MAG: C4-dicarboxylate ABC transporter permease [Alphaproteobacteria bacterium]